ncbi:MAG: pyridoxal-phosphate dependent enzyme, partial [Armatimonadaceae bacterium]
DRGRAEYVSVTDDDALDALAWTARTEGILPALETAHAFAHVRRLAPTMSPDQVIVVCLSGRGDKDVDQVARRMEMEN